MHSGAKASGGFLVPRDMGQVPSDKNSPATTEGETMSPVTRHPSPDSFVVFVPFVIVGETVEVEIIEVKKNFARAKLLRVITLAPERVNRRNAVTSRNAGGCQYQHIEYAAQLRFKHKQIADLFERFGKISRDKVAPVIPCPSPYGYRNRIMIRSQWNGPAKKLVIGFIRADNNFVEDIEECKIAEPAISEQIQQVRANPPPKGGIKVVLRIPPDSWDVPPDSFFQNNFFLLPKLVETVRGFLKSSGTKHLVDLYCGVGFFGIEMADAVESFVGVELDQLAIKDRRGKTPRRGKSPTANSIPAAVEEILPELLQKFSPAATTVILDPPRKKVAGRKPCQLLRETRPAQVIYVSCHPATLARDLNILCADRCL